MADEDATTNPMLETLVGMMKQLQSDVTAVQTNLAAVQSDVSAVQTNLAAVQSDVSAIKIEQSRQARQLDSMAKDPHTFAADLL